MIGSFTTNNKPHVVLVPFPLQGHITPTLKLAKLLHQTGFHVTFVNTKFNHNRIVNLRGPDALNGLPDFRFETIPIEHPPSDSNTSLALNLFSLKESCRKDFLATFRELLRRLSDSKTVPPVTCVVADLILTQAVTVAEELGIPCALFCTMSACGFLGFKQSREQLKKCLDDNGSNEKDEKALDESVNWVPGEKNQTLRDVANFMKAKDAKASIKESAEKDQERIGTASAIIFHTFDSLEGEDMSKIASVSKTYSIGPLQMQLNSSLYLKPQQHDSIECSLWNDQESECIKWLDSKEPNSVIYVNFGSVTVLSAEQVIELAWGLANSKQNFLWIIRKDLVMGDTAVLPQDFLSQVKDRCFLASWCRQERVLKHEAVGGFLTHCGWNSVVESISEGVPMICFPTFADQYSNSKKMCNDWGVGLQLDDDFKRDELEKIVRELMCGNGTEGKKVRERVIEWRTKAKVATCSSGSSSLNLDKLVNDVLLQKQ